MGLIDLTGQQFGRLTILYRDKEAEKLKKDRHAMWRCQCECGNLTSVVGRDLRRGATLSCGCLQKERTSRANGVNFIGKTFGKLTVLQQAPSKNQRTYWVCKCECGNETVKLRFPCGKLPVQEPIILPFKYTVAAGAISGT